MPNYTPSSTQGELPDRVRERVEAALRRHVQSWRRPDTGLSAAYRFIVEFRDGACAFVKAATTPETTAWLRNEHVAIEGAHRFAPRVLAWIDDAGEQPILVTDYLGGHWPASHAGVNWRADDLERVFSTLDELALVSAPQTLDKRATPTTQHWRAIAESPSSFFELRMSSPEWFANHVGELVAAEESLNQTGASFVHGDMRSDNICLLPDGPRFVDWSNARAGAAHTDLATLLPAAHLEGGPAPHVVLPDGAPWAAMQSGDLVLRAVDRQSNAPPWLRRVFRRLAAINLDWAIASLGMPPRDGVAWRDA